MIIALEKGDCLAWIFHILCADIILYVVNTRESKCVFGLFLYYTVSQLIVNRAILQYDCNMS